jgi:hypothetical protein
MSTTAALAGTVPAGGAADPATPAAPKDPHLEALGRAEQAARAKHYREAIGICEDVLEASPEHPAALALLGAIHGQRGAIEAGIPLLERACARQAGVANWWVNLSGLYRMQCRMEQALATARRAVQLQANAVSLFNLAKVHMDRGEHDEAATFFLAALARAPDHAEAHLGLGQVLLMRGQMRPGWIEYEWRNATEQAKGMLPKMGAPMWNGMALPNARILLVGDQGYGDTLQFARFIPAVAARVREVLLACSTDLAPLLGRIPGVHACHTSWAGIPGHAAYCRLSSLPGVLGTELDTIPGPHPYLAAEPERVADWRARLDGRIERGRFRVGLCWAGRTTHPNDTRRSLRLGQLAPLAAVPAVALVSLAKAPPAADAEAMAQMGVLDLSAELGDFGETAAVIANLDLLVTVDSAVAHLAGALGRPVWTLLARPSDWRWLLERTDSPWYPSLRLFRQPQPGAWDPVIAAVAEALAPLAARREVAMA